MECGGHAAAQIMKRICIFCGSYSGVRSAYASAARAMAGALVRSGLEIVYGGGRVGLMGIIADEALRLGGTVVGVIPRTLRDREVGHDGLTELHVVETMHARKAMMADLADAFVALPGGLGTIEEIFEVWTWAQLGMHQKPCGFLDVAGYYAPLAAFLDHATREGFIRPQLRAAAMFESDPETMLRRFAAYAPPPVEKWIDRART
jgi:uncharacterized protein (TIGR00730 family)